MLQQVKGNELSPLPLLEFLTLLFVLFCFFLFRKSLLMGVIIFGNKNDVAPKGEGLLSFMTSVSEHNFYQPRIFTSLEGSTVNL